MFEFAYDFVMQPVKTMISAKKKKGTSKPKADTNNNDESYDECTSSYVYCGKGF